MSRENDLSKAGDLNASRSASGFDPNLDVAEDDAGFEDMEGDRLEGEELEG